MRGFCTDAAAEGLNFQFCGGLVNYDMPWNPMRVEQRIGRIDRLGQVHKTIRVVSLHYEDTVETDVYVALRARIHLFEQFVGRLQPILARLPRAIADVALSGDNATDRDLLVTQLNRDADRADQAGFDLDAATEPDLDVPPRPRRPMASATFTKSCGARICCLLAPRSGLRMLIASRYSNQGCTIASG